MVTIGLNVHCPIIMDIENEIAAYLLHIYYNITMIAKNVTNSGFGAIHKTLHEDFGVTHYLINCIPAIVTSH